jgi:hypothetical protein
MKEPWFMVLDEKDNTWHWCVFSGNELVFSRGTFLQYIDACEDAAKHGYTSTPVIARKFRPPAAKTRPSPPPQAQDGERS